uniref:Uncharacterized protein n=1 Tax=Anguilla anguilla TaxID=7936 RepID=A0A0E9PPC9_ANGAN
MNQHNLRHPLLRMHSDGCLRTSQQTGVWSSVS